MIMKARYFVVMGAIAAGALAELAPPSAARRAAADAPAYWAQWGGPNRNFMSDAKGLASSWPAGGPKKRWSRALGEGHSAILTERGRLYTMYRPIGLTSLVRRSQQEAIVALDSATGQPGWATQSAAQTTA